jgi:hypothetical protein
MPTLQNKIGIVQRFILNGVVDHVSRLCSCKKWPNSRGPFEGPATVKPPALPEDTYSEIS